MENLLIFIFAVILDFHLINFPNRLHPAYWSGCLSLLAYRTLRRGGFIREGLPQQFILSLVPLAKPPTHPPKRKRGLSAIILAKGISLSFVLLNHLLVQLIVLAIWFVLLDFFSAPWSFFWQTIIMTILLASTFSLGTFREHALAVYRALQQKNLRQAQLKVSKMVGRKTERMKKSAVIRACIESIGENLSDSVIAPLFYFTIGFIVASFFSLPLLERMMLGISSGIFYRQANLMDALFGYKNKQFYYFGWGSARLDDFLNFIPARISAILLILSAGLQALFLRNDNSSTLMLQSAWIWQRDHKKHSSPNAGQGEAALAGALQIQLGGISHYPDGQVRENPIIGKITFIEKRRFSFLKNQRLQNKHILLATRLLSLASFLCYLIVFLLLLYFTI